MTLKGIVHITGLPGLYKVLTSTRSNFIVETIGEKGKKMPVSANARVAALSEISIYTYEDQVNLIDVLKSIKNSGIPIPDAKAEKPTLMAFMRQILPDFDEERVYVSDIKKLIKWFQLLDNEIDLNATEEEGDVKA